MFYEFNHFNLPIKIGFMDILSKKYDWGFAYYLENQETDGQ